MALQTATKLPEDDLVLITLRLTFDGTPCPFEWGIMSESICDFANKLLKCEEWDPLTLHVLVQSDILTREYLDDNVPFAMGRELIADVPVNPCSYADVYIDDMTGLTINLFGMRNTGRLEPAIPLAIKVAAWPSYINEPIPREPMVAQDKLKAEGGLAEPKIILGWHFNFCTLTMALPEHKHIAWSSKIWTMIADGRMTKKAIESTIGQLGHVLFVIPWVFHFLSHLRTLLSQACNKRAITVDKNCKNNLVLMIKILNKTKGGIDMNLLSFCSPNRIYYLDSCPAGLGGYSNQGFAWHFRIPDDLLFRVSNILLEFLIGIIMPWIDIIGRRLSLGDCALLMTDSTIAKGWMKKLNFSKAGNDPIQALTYIDAARKYA